MPTPAPRPIESWGDAQLRNYQALCVRELKQDLARHQQAEDDLRKLKKGSRARIFWAALGGAGFVGGLATTPITGPLSMTVAGASGAAAMQALDGVRRAIGDRARLSADIRQYENRIDYWRREQSRIREEWQRRQG